MSQFIGRQFWRYVLAALGTAFLAFTAAPVWADGETDPSVGHDVLTLVEAAQLLRIEPGDLENMVAANNVPGRRVGQTWRFNREALLAWLNGDWELIVTAVPPSATPLAARDMMAIAAAGTTEMAQADAPATDSGDAPIGEAPTERTAEEIFLRSEKILLAPGEVTAEAGLFYAESDNQQLAIANGGIGLATVEQQTFTTLLQARVGVYDETEVFANTTFFDQDTDVFLGGSKIAESDRTKLGRVGLGARHTLLSEGAGYPGVIATVNGLIPTGDSSYAVGGGLAVVKSVDPVVLFANANYRHTFSRDFADVSLLEPKNRVDATVGYALALNDTLTLSTSVSGVFTRAANFTAASLRRSENYSLQFGLTSWLAKGLYIEPTVAFNLNGPGDSFVFGLTMPYTFSP